MVVEGGDEVDPVDVGAPVEDGEVWEGVSGAALVAVGQSTTLPLRVRLFVWASPVPTKVPKPACNSEIRRSDTRT